MSRTAVKVAGLLTLGALLLASMAYAQWNQWRSGSGSLHVLASGAPLDVLVDGVEVGKVRPMAVSTFELKSGTHTVTLATHPERDSDGRIVKESRISALTVSGSGFSELVVGAPHHCLAVLDITEGTYGPSATHWRAVDWRQPDEAMELPKHTYAGWSTIPHQIRDGERVQLVIPAPCFLEGKDLDLHGLADTRIDYAKNSAWLRGDRGR